MLDSVTYDGQTGITASIMLPLFLLHLNNVCFAVMSEKPLIERNKENI